MTSFLTIALLILTVLSTLSSFGGKTWKEGTEPIIERITARGWVALVLLLLALAVGVIKELYTSKVQAKKDSVANIAAKQAELDSKQTKLDADEKQRALQATLSQTQQQLAIANVQMKGLQREDKLIQDQITGGDGFPEAWIFTNFPDTDGSFALQLMVAGAAPLTDVSMTVTQGAYVRPSPEEIQKQIAQSAQSINGHAAGPPAMFVGTLHPNVYQPSNAHVRPSADGSVNTYRIYFQAANGAVQETLEIRFNKELNIWQYRLKVVSERTRDANKVLTNQDWQPRGPVKILVGEGAPTNRKPKKP